MSEDSHLGDFIEDTTLRLPLDSATTGKPACGNAMTCWLA